MDNNFTPYLFQYTYFAGRDHSFFFNLKPKFDYEYWLTDRINRLIDSAPELPDEMIKAILKKAKVC